MHERLIEKLETYIKVKAKEVVTKEIEVYDITFMKLRDYLTGIGAILEEDEKNQIYLIIVSEGFFRLNTALVAVQLCNQKVYFAAYAKEGLIKQSTAKKAIARLEEVIRKII